MILARWFINMFFLDPNFNNCFTISDLTLSRVLLMNNSLYPWLILVPMKENLQEIIDLNTNERYILMDEISFVSEIILKEFKPFKLNVAALGNVTKQLHIHIIGRNQNDASWPDPVWGNGKPAQAYDPESLAKMLEKIKLHLEK